MTSRTTVVHCKRAPYDVYIGRPSPFGNPFKLGPDGGRTEVLAKYVDWLDRQPEIRERGPAGAGGQGVRMLVQAGGVSWGRARGHRER